MKSAVIGMKTNLPSCPVCMENVGTYGGPVSLPCGHNGCLTCLQEIHLATPLCPLCRAPFDSKLTLRPNFDLKEALEKMQSAASSFKHGISRSFSDIEASKQNSSLREIPCDSDHSEGLELSDDPWVRVSVSQKGRADCSSPLNLPDNSAPEVNIRNILSGLFAIITGQNSSYGTNQISEDRQETSSQVSSEEFVHHDESIYYPGVDLPSAPPLVSQGFDHLFFQTILEAEPPQWVPDSAATSCMHCRAPFKPVVRGRHHCRFCGGIFCRACSLGKCLLPIKFRERKPQRVCDACYEKLEPLQRFLIKHVSNAAQIAKHDVIDWTCMRAWMNSPLGLSMEDDIYKASNVLRSYFQIARLEPESSIPVTILEGAKGLAILTVAKAGFGVTYKFGTGIVIARKVHGQWSAPSSIASFGLGWGAQVGGELTDFVIVLSNTKAVKAFCSRIHFSLGGGLSIAAGPVGRALEADYRAGDEGNAACYTYSCSKGAFVGISLEGNIVTARTSANMKFYGDPYITPSDILLGPFERPRAAAPLYSALSDLFNNLERFSG